MSVLLCLAFCGGCATSGNEILTPPVARSGTPLGVTKKILVTPFTGEGGECFAEQARAYLQGVGFDVLFDPTAMDARQLEEFAARSEIDVILSGSVERLQTGSDSSSRNFTVGALSAGLLTAPIAGVYAASTRWKGFAAAAAKMTVSDARSDETVWARYDSVGLSAEGSGLSSDADIRRVLLPRVCKDLATKLLNDFLSKYRGRSKGD